MQTQNYHAILEVQQTSLTRPDTQLKSLISHINPRRPIQRPCIIPALRNLRCIVRNFNWVGLLSILEVPVINEYEKHKSIIRHGLGYADKIELTIQQIYHQR